MTAEKHTSDNQSQIKLGEKIRMLRKQRGMNQEELAEKAGINRSYLSLVENDRSSPTVDLVERIARGLGISVWILLEDSTEHLKDPDRDNERIVSEEKHFEYDTGEIFDLYEGLRDFLGDEDEMMLIQPTGEEVEALKGIRFSGNFRPDKRFYRDALLAYRRRLKSNSSKGYPDSTT